MGSDIAAQLIGHKAPGLRALTVEQLAEEASCGTPVTPGLSEDIDHIALLIDCPPEIVPAPADGHEHFVQVPCVAQPPLMWLERPGAIWPKLETPQAYGLVGDRGAPLGQEILNVPEAQTETVVEPDGMADDFRRESVSVVAGRPPVHRPTLPVTTST